MDGEFIRKKPSIALMFLLLFGIFCIGLDPIGASELLTILTTGILVCLSAIFCMLFNLGAYLRVEEDIVCGKYGWFGKLNCRIDEVDFALPRMYTLTIQLKNGKRHTINGLRNPYDVSTAIRRKNFQLEEASPEVLRAELEQLMGVRKKELRWVTGGCILLFVNIFLAVFLTGGRELYDFSKSDWIFFGIMAFIELLTVIGLFYLAGRYGKHLMPIEQLGYRLRGAVILSYPLPSNQILSVYTDPDYAVRVVVCGFPNDESVYYLVQVYDGGKELETVDTSGNYDSIDALPGEDFSKLIDITSLVVPA